jgi:uncharacterized RDD family membrane protein YckC
MEKELLPAKFSGINDEVYAGFWIRLAARLVDLIIMLPFIALVGYVGGLSKSDYFYTIVPNLVFYIWFEVYLVKRYGGTPGKLILGIKILQKNGKDVDGKAAGYRYIVSFFLTILSIFVMVLTLNLIDDSTYISLGFFKRSQFLQTLNPIPMKVANWSSIVWQITGVIVLISNMRKRAVHDFIAGTVVIKSIYIDKIRELINPQISDEKEL